MWQISREHCTPPALQVHLMLSYRKCPRVRWHGKAPVAQLFNIMASVFHGEKVVPERIQPISTLKLHFQPCSCKKEVSPVLHYRKASNSVARAPEGPLIILKGSMKGNYEKIRYSRNPQGSANFKKKAENHRFRLLLPSSFLEASTGKVRKCFQLSPKMTDEGTLHNQVLNVLTLPGALPLTANELIAPAAPTSLVLCVIHLHTLTHSFSPS